MSLTCGNLRAALDETSRRILGLLQLNGRQSYREIGQSVGISEAAARKRVHRLIEQGVMQIVAVPNPLLPELGAQAMLGLHVEGDWHVTAAGLKALVEVSQVAVCAGSFDLLVEVLCDDLAHLETLLDGSIRSIPGVRGIEVFVYLRVEKRSQVEATVLERRRPLLGTWPHP